jgi:hypothetical protein
VRFIPLLVLEYNGIVCFRFSQILFYYHSLHMTDHCYRYTNTLQFLTQTFALFHNLSQFISTHSELIPTHSQLISFFDNLTRTYILSYFSCCGNFFPEEVSQCVTHIMHIFLTWLTTNQPKNFPCVRTFRLIY